MIKKLYQFCTLQHQLLQGAERYYYLNHNQNKTPKLQEDYKIHKNEYLKQLLECDINKTKNWQWLVINLYKLENEPSELLKQLILKYKQNFDINELLQIKNKALTYLLIDNDNIYYLMSDQFLNCDNMKQIYEQYELTQTKYRNIPLNLLFKHIIKCQKLNLQTSPLQTFNLIHYYIENCQGIEFINDLITFQRSIRSSEYKLPNETWYLIINKISQAKYNNQEFLLICQILQQYAHQKIQIKFDFSKLFIYLINQYKQQHFKENCLLELLRTINIFKANKYELIEFLELQKICQNEKQLIGEKEYDIFTGIKHSTTTTTIQINDNTDLNNIITDVLIKNPKQLTEQEQNTLRDLILNKLSNQLDDNSLKKIIVLNRVLWPNEISLVRKCAQQIRIKLGENQQTKSMISLVINALYEFKRIQYPFIDQLLLNYLASINDLYIPPQEISILLYYICLTQPKLTKKQLMSNYKIEQKYDITITKILNNLLPVIKKMATKKALRLKVIYTVTDCICKYKNELTDFDLNHFFEKLEYNLVNELEIMQQCKTRPDQKDLDFLETRFQYLKVGSRKLMRFFNKAQKDYSGALKELLRRQRVYLRMKSIRGKAVKASQAF